MIVMFLEIDIQRASREPDLPGDDEVRRWVEAALRGRRERAELAVRLVDEPEGAVLNERFRGRSGPTNVLSFPYEPHPGLAGCDLIGDLVICAPLVVREASDQGKTAESHWAHMLVHGVLHLLGYDHCGHAQTTEMEALERDILGALGFPDPYEVS